MSMKRGIIVWISTFITFLSIITSIGMVVSLINEGAGSIVSPYLLSSIAGAQPVETYLFVSLVASSICLAFTCIIVYRKQPPDPEIVNLLLALVGNLSALKQNQENKINDLAEKLESGRKLSQTMFSQVSSDFEEGKKEVFDLLARQGTALKKVRSDLLSAIEAKIVENREKMLFDLKKQEGVILGVKRLAEEYVSDLNKQWTELGDIRISLGRIEENLVTNHAKLKSLDDPEEIKGIGPALGKDLRLLGISSVGEFLIADPSAIGDKTRVSKDMAENLQAMGQLMMVPGVDSSDAELLVDVGIKSRKELVDFDLIQLSRKVGELAKIYVEQGKLSKDQCPTIEEIASWKRMAR